MRIKRILATLAIIILEIIGMTSNVYAASTIDRVDIVVDIDKSGTAHFKEVWNATVENGTEASKELIQLGNSKVTNFKVKDETGKEYRNIGTWDSTKSRIEKYTSSGTKTKLNGDTTLYWGLGDYGQRAYIIEYDIDKFIQSSLEGQFTYFTFISPNQVPHPKDSTVQINIPKDMKFDIENCFGYGYTGTIEPEKTETGINEYTINVIPDEYTYSNGGYTVLLVKYDNAVKFENDTKSSKSFIDIVEEANEGYGIGVTTKPITVKEIAVIGATAIAGAMFIVVVITTVKRRKRMRNKSGLPIKINMAEGTEQLAEQDSRNAGFTQQELEHNNTLFEVYLVGNQYKTVPNQYTIFSAMILKWVLNGNMSIQKDENSRTKFILMLDKIPDKEKVSIFESELYKIFEYIERSDTSYHGIDSFKLDRWMKENSIKLFKWRDEVLRAEARELQKQGMLNVIVMSERMQNSVNFTEYETTNEFKQYGEKIQRCKKYIRNFEYSVEGIHELKCLMVFAQLFEVTNVFLEEVRATGCNIPEYEILNNSDKETVLTTISQINSIISTRMESKHYKAEKRGTKNKKKHKNKNDV